MKLWVIIDDSNIYELAEEKPVTIDAEKLPIKIMAKNGYHSSKPLYITRSFQSPLFIEVGCTADNPRLWGGVLLSFLLFVLFWGSGLYIFMILANLPLLFVAWHFFFNKNFITVSVLKIED